jgi:TrmH family RNA methyltransferase
MLAKNEAKFINSLKLKKNRDAEGLFIAEGVKIVNDLLHSGIKVKQIYSSRNFQLSIFNYHIDVIRIKDNELQRISSLSNPNEVLAVCEIPSYTLVPAQLKNKLTLVLDTLQDPGNLGTIIRIADWFGIENIVCSNETVEVYNPKVIQATMGSISRVKVHYVDLQRFVEEAKVALPGLKIYGAVLDGENLYDSELSPQGLILIGNESKGISAELLSSISHKVRIPSYAISEPGMQSGPVSVAESLNAAIATSILCAEFRRRK